MKCFICKKEKQNLDLHIVREHGNLENITINADNGEIKMFNVSMPMFKLSCSKCSLVEYTRYAENVVKSMEKHECESGGESENTE